MTQPPQKDATGSGGTPPPPYLSMGLDTYKISIKDVFGANRTKLLSKLKQNNSNEMMIPPNSLIYMVGGISENRNDTDHEPLFRQESYFLYLLGVKEPDCASIINVDTGHTTLLIPKLPPEYATFMGRIKTPDEWRTTYQVDDVQYMENVETILEEMLLNKSNGEKKMKNGITTTNNGGGSHYSSKHNASTSTPKLFLMQGRNSDSGNFYQPPKLHHNSSKTLMDASDFTLLFDVLAECRVFKSKAELNLLQHVTELTSLAHVYVMKHTSVKMMEYQSESLFRHYIYYNYGCRFTGYTNICGCGPNSAVLHYGHAGEPNARQLSESDMCLFDMGAEYFGYGSDVTCSFPASGKFTKQQAMIYNGVLNAQRAVYRMLKPGVSWVDCHKAAEAAILTMLIEVGVVVAGTKSVEELVEMRLGAVFMPHGLGHFIGIDTHDVGGYLSHCPSRSSLPGLKSLRTARVIQTNMVLTVEPGCYFIDHLLDEALDEKKSSLLRDYLNTTRIEEFRGFGGVRLEDVVAITDTGCTNFTICPRTIAEVEHVMAGGKWPPLKDEAPELLRVRLTDPTPLPPPPPSL